MDKSKISVILSERVGAGVGAKDPRTNPGADPRSSQRSFAPLGPTHPSLRMTQNLQCFFSQVQRSRCEKAQDDTNLLYRDFFTTSEGDEQEKRNAQWRM